MQHVSTYISHLQAKLRTVIALQGGCMHLGSHIAYSVFAMVFYTQCDLYFVLYSIIVVLTAIYSNKVNI